MSRYLLDINALIALLDPDHTFQEAVSHWFYADPRRHWLTCPITENGTIRIIGLPRYPQSQPLRITIEALRSLTSFGHHEHIPDDVSLLGSDIDPRRIHGPGQITDTYLALLAQAHGAALATTDRKLSTRALGSMVEVFQIPT